MLGMSFATFVGIVDWILSFTLNVFCSRYRRVKKLGRAMSQRRRKASTFQRSGGLPPASSPPPPPYVTIEDPKKQDVRKPSKLDMLREFGKNFR